MTETNSTEMSKRPEASVSLHWALFFMLFIAIYVAAVGSVYRQYRIEKAVAKKVEASGGLVWFENRSGSEFVEKIFGDGVYDRIERVILFCEESPVDESVFKQLGKLQMLRDVYLVGDEAYDPQVRLIGNCLPRLQRLHIEARNLSVSELNKLRELKELEYLRVACATEDQIQQLEALGEWESQGDFVVIDRVDRQGYPVIDFGVPVSSKFTVPVWTRASVHSILMPSGVSKISGSRPMSQKPQPVDFIKGPPST